MEEPVKKFRPERPIYLNEQNTGFKTKVEVIFAIEKLRSQGWLCAYGEKVRPFHMSFNDMKEFATFKKSASDLSIKLKAPLIVKDEDLAEMEAEDNKGQVVPGAEENDSVEYQKSHIE